MTLRDIESDESVPKPQYFIFFHPSDERCPDITDSDQLMSYYEAASYIDRRLATSRHILVGEFLEAVREAEEKDDYEKLDEIVETLKK